MLNGPTEKTLGKSMVWMSLPVAELVLLRWFLHSFLKLKLGFPGFTDFELLFPAPLALIGLVLALDQAAPLKLSWSNRRALVHGFFILIFLGISIFYTQLENLWGGHLLKIWWLLLFSVVLSGFGVLVKLQEVFRNPNRWALLPCLLMAFSLVLNLKFGGFAWRNFLFPLGQLVNRVLEILGNDAIVVMVLRKKYLWIQHPQLNILVGQGCSGFDGLLFFFSAFTLFACLNWSQLRTKNWVLSLFAGGFIFLMLNIIRLLILFSLGVLLVRQLGVERGLFWTLGIFHTHSGYLLYGVGLAIYFQGLSYFLGGYKSPFLRVAREPV